MKEAIKKVVKDELCRQGYTVKYDEVEPYALECLENLKGEGFSVSYHETFLESTSRYLVILKCEQEGGETFWSLDGFSLSDGGDYVDLETIERVRPVEKMITVWE